MAKLDEVPVSEEVAVTRPDAIVNQMTGPCMAHAGTPNLRKADRSFAAIDRLRSERIDHLLATGAPTSSRWATPGSTEFAGADGSRPRRTLWKKRAWPRPSADACMAKPTRTPPVQEDRRVCVPVR